MYLFLSPAKTLDMEPTNYGFKATRPVFETKETAELIGILKQKTKADIAALMGLSDKLAELNFGRYQDFANLPQKPALLAFQGDVYQGLDAKTLSAEEQNFATRHVGILSGLYGILRAGDLMRAYRLEMGTSLVTPKGKNLYDFWGDKVTHAINQNLKDTNSTDVINLASNEYAKVVQTKKLDKPVTEITFREIKGGQEKVIGLFAKKARGMMARYMVQNQIKNKDDLRGFKVGGYAFDKAQSNDHQMIFKRSHD